MDLREKKTKRSIRGAFLQLRARKPLERITVKELCALAEISKATFYLHYQDLYDLSDRLQQEVVRSILACIAHPERFVSEHERFVRELFDAFHAQQSLIEILFADTQTALLPVRIERELKEMIYRLEPALREDVTRNILLTYQIQGGFSAYMEHRREFGADRVRDTISRFSALLSGGLS